MLSTSPSDLLWACYSAIPRTTTSRLCTASILLHVLTCMQEEQPDNEDNCAACGGVGGLVLCEGCVRSFHYTCVEPPLPEAPFGRWYCRACITRKYDQAVRHGKDIAQDPRDVVPDVDGVFGTLFNKLHGQAERSYALPKVVAEAFEGVKVGGTGEYEEITLRNRFASTCGCTSFQLLTSSRVRNADDEMADIKKFRESVKNGTAMCFACGGSSNEDRRDIDPNTVPRELVSCDYCVLSWHLDCLDPPRASNPKLVAQDETEPLPKAKGKKKDKPKVITTWMCPNHVTDDPSGDGLQGTSRAVNGGRIGKLRRPKHATIKDVSLRRGFHNNGLIEILNDPSDTEKEEDETGIIYRLSEKAIKLDFIDCVKQCVPSFPPCC